jgi:hypothetical protein
MARKRITDLIKVEKFHEEITTEDKYRDDIIENEIIVYDVSGVLKHKKGDKYKYDSDNVIILFSYADDKENTLYRGWVSGMVLIDQLNKLKDSNLLPDKEGIEMKLIKKGSYYIFE